MATAAAAVTSAAAASSSWTCVSRARKNGS
jgi:hypothetical protein